MRPIANYISSLVRIDLRGVLSVITFSFILHPEIKNQETYLSQNGKKLLQPPNVHGIVNYLTITRSDFRLDICHIKSLTTYQDISRIFHRYAD